MTGGMGGGGPRVARESRLRGASEWGVWGVGGHESRAYGGRALAMTDVNGQVLDSSRSLGMTGGMGVGGPRLRGEGEGERIA